jgi:hypothetical protein
MASVDPGNPRYFHVTIQGPGEVRARAGGPSSVQISLKKRHFQPQRH